MVLELTNADPRLLAMKKKAGEANVRHKIQSFRRKGAPPPFGIIRYSDDFLERQYSGVANLQSESVIPMTF